VKVCQHPTFSYATPQDGERNSDSKEDKGNLKNSGKSIKTRHIARFHGKLAIFMITIQQLMNGNDCLGKRYYVRPIFTYPTDNRENRLRKLSGRR
jgi:hypothetical protein